ncbi:MAG: sulfatase-like hydrolase/transferase [Defluviitaleaceae bacterium]|nr:sulfatase-like hydrolase/transferase [Defluviitaleaceae bacterium]
MKPNFLFIFPDQHRGDWMPYSSETKKKLGVSELTLEVPNIKNLMENGVSFTHAVSPSPVCAPARACLAAGKRYVNCRVPNNGVNFDPTVPTFYGALKNDGYSVGGVGKFDLNKADLYWGKDKSGWHELLDQVGFTHTCDNEGKLDTIWGYYNETPGPYGKYLAGQGLMEAHAEDMIGRLRTNKDAPTPLPENAYCDNWVTQNALDMLQEFPEEKPWFMQVNFVCPHDPWDVTAAMKDEYKARTYPAPVEYSLNENNNGVRQNYASMINNIDKNIGKILAAIEARGDLENTIIIYSSDHGEMLGDHNMYGKSKPNQAAIHVPLVIDASRVGGLKGIENPSPVEMQDIAATILEYAGLCMDTGLGSVSLKPVLDGNATKTREYCVSELIWPIRNELAIPFGTVSDGRYKLIMTVGKDDRLYDLDNDPFECKELAAGMPEVVNKLKRQFDERAPWANKGVIRAFEKAAKKS